jgi:Ca-activated chloride channel homolog
MSRTRYGVLGALAVTALLAGPAPAAVAAPAPAAAGESTPVMVVLDASGSMKQADAPGPRIEAAKKAVTGLVDALPADARIGLTVYGTSTGSGAADKARGCRDITQLIPVQRVDRGAFSTAVAGIKASGYTPIGRSLQQAAAALPAEGPRSIVLVSDGEDTCAPPAPCDVAKQLKAAGTELVVHTIGFKVDAAARAQLSCVAAATGGTYREAASGAALGAVLTNRVERAIRPYTAVGIPIRGGATPAAAPAITPGQYLDTYEVGGTGPGKDGTVKYYAVRLTPGDTPYFSATIAPPGARTKTLDALQVLLDLVDGNGDSCVSADANAFDLGVFGKVTPQTAVLAPRPVGEGWSDDCLGDHLAYLKVRRGGEAFRTQQLPMEIAYRSEPPVSSPGPAAATVRSTALPSPPEGTARPVAAGFSYNDAPELTPGTYSDAIVAGETRYFKVRLGWGQRLGYRLTVPAQAGIGIQSAALYVNLASPLRARLDQPSGVRSYDLIGGKDDQTMFGSTEAPVRYANRESDAGRIDLVSVDGDYYVVLDASYPLGDRESFSMPFRLTIAVDGTVEPGPTYVTDPGASATPGPSGSPTPSAATTTFSASDPVGGSGPPGGWLVWSVAAVVAALAVGAATLIARRRQVS